MRINALFNLAFKSLKSRWLSALLCVFSISLSVFLLLGVERLRSGAEKSFSGSLSQTDLIVGARGSDVQLLLYTVFHMGEAVQNISFESYEYFSRHPAVEWTIPISLGDSHKGFRVVATNENFYKYFRYRGDESVYFRQGRAPEGVFEVVLGAEVAKKLGYQMGDEIIVSHGLSEVSLRDHGENPFKVVGILKNTGTPVDKSLFIGLEGMEALHMNWQSGAFLPSSSPHKGVELEKKEIQVRQITSFLVRTKNRVALLGLQREVALFQSEPLMSLIPGVTLSRLWATLSYADLALKVIATCVALVSIFGFCLILLSSQQERKREMSIFRAMGLGASALTFLQALEGLFLCLVGIIFGLALLFGIFGIGGRWLMENFSVYLPLEPFSTTEWAYLGAMVIATFIFSLGPAVLIYRKSAGEGLSPKGF